MSGCLDCNCRITRAELQGNRVCTECNHLSERNRNFQSQGDFSPFFFPVSRPMPESRTRQAFGWGTNSINLSPNRVIADDDYATSSELRESLNKLEEDRLNFVDSFACALGKMKKYEKKTPSDAGPCNLCHRKNLSGYKCVTCADWICRNCFPVAMRAKTRINVVDNEIVLKCPYCTERFNEPLGPPPNYGKH